MYLSIIYFNDFVLETFEPKNSMMKRKSYNNL